MLKKEYNSVEIQTVLNEVKRSFLPKGDKRALVVSLDYNASIYLDEPIEVNGDEIWEISSRNFVEIMFYNPNNYCTVAYRLNNPYGETNDFHQVANHDSCWRDGVSRCLEEGYKNLDELFTKECSDLGLDEESLTKILSDKNIHLHKDFGIGDGFKLIEEPEIRSDESNVDNYYRDLQVNF
jgi:hypothetical protein